MSKQVTLSFDIGDVEFLYTSSYRSFYFAKIDRFEVIKDSKLDSYEDEGNFMYYVDGYANTLLFTKILNAFGFSTAVLDDAASEDSNEFVVLTDYAGNFE